MGTNLLAALDDYEIRRRVLAAIDVTPITYGRIVESCGISRGKGEYPVRIDRALQALRKEGQIRFITGKGWVKDGVRECPHCGGRGYVQGR